MRNKRCRGGERKRREPAAPPRRPQLKISQRVTYMILQPGKRSSGWLIVHILPNTLHIFNLPFLPKPRTSLDQTTLNQSVSVNGVHSDNDTSQVRHVPLHRFTHLPSHLYHVPYFLCIKLFFNILQLHITIWIFPEYCIF